ncbi:hypothetical protein ABRY23_06310 [Melioribacteraceae bacterium 4301-Me]|uniref:hypothetical protein n=1 Tax=Pyranulibacter aquaticus TaxID=3163344 RepID=UPI0035977A9F
MKNKKFWVAFLVVFIILILSDYVINGIILNSTYSSEEVSKVFRPTDKIISNMWIMWVVDLIWSYFFVFFFAKGYENRGVIEGLRYGFYIGIFFYLTSSYYQYAVYPLPYSLIFQWFVYGLVQALILGLITALIYKPAQPKQTES